MFKSLAGFAFLIIQLLTVDSFASATDSSSLAAVAAGKEIYGKGIYNKCPPFALGLAQVFHDRYKVAWVGTPTSIDQHSRSRVYRRNNDGGNVLALNSC